MKLQVLRLDSNKLSFIAPCTFHELKHLRLLNLSNNYLTLLADNVFCRQMQSHLMEVYIGWNYIRSMDKIVLSRMPNLTHLDITPLQICCFLPRVGRCYPKEKFYLSTCTSLLGLSFRYSVLLAGIVALFISTCSIIWIFREIRSLGYRPAIASKNLNNTLNLLLFICHSFKGLHLITLALVDAVFHGYYALYEEMWRRHPFCILLNMLSFTCLMGSEFVFLLNAYIRKIAIVYPFKLANVSVSRPIWAAACFVCLSFIVSYFPFLGIKGLPNNELPIALGFGLLLPVGRQGLFSSTLWACVSPMVIMLCLSSAFQIACICVLAKNSRKWEQNLQTSMQGRGPVARCVVTLVLHVCCQMPLVCLHIASLSGIDFSAHFAVASTVLTLLLCPIVNATLFIVITPHFLRYVLQ